METPYIKINGVPLPTPRDTMQYITTTTVNSARNVNNVVVGSKVGRDQTKLNNLEWGYLPAATWEAVLREFNKFQVTLEYFEPSLGKRITRQFYPGDRSYNIGKVDKVNARPIDYRNCKCNLIDMGK